MDLGRVRKNKWITNPFESDDKGMIKLQDGQYLGFSPDGHVISKRPDDYDRVFTSENSYYVNGFKTKSGEYYMWDDTQKLYVLGTKTFKGWEETNGAEKSVTGKVAVWKTGINPQCYALYQFIEVKSYDSSEFETVKQQFLVQIRPHPSKQETSFLNFPRFPF